MPRYHAIVPAAGSGSRFGAELPKQYLPLCGRPMIFHALLTLAQHPKIDRVWVVLAPGDVFWKKFDWQALGPKVDTVYCGGATRAESVTRGLMAAETALAADDWVLVHDAARPCLSAQLLSDLIDCLSEDPVGGLLATPLADTLKRADGAGRSVATVSREGLWQAQTPQMFRAGVLREALQKAQDDPHGITDEASAVERLGLKPRLVLSDTNNFKVTVPADFHLAERLLMERL
jgi:2-C-methyl-D-erythritol 4-phosphate cytidylyltransferase